MGLKFVAAFQNAKRQAGLRSFPQVVRLASAFLILITTIHFCQFFNLVYTVPLHEVHLNQSSFRQRAFGALELYDKLLEAESSHFPSFSWRQSESERMAVRLFPFIQNPSRPFDNAPLKSLRSTFTPNSKGIVIPVGKNNAIFARHAILALRDVLNVTLPIAIAYAGDEDLPVDQQRELLAVHDGVERLDVTATLTDKFMHLRHGSWAIKPFSVLASRFEQVILIDADTVFVQPAEVLFNHPGYEETGTLFFRERHLDQVDGNERQEFIKEQSEGIPLLDTCCQKMLRQGYRDEQDSGIVVIDKRRLRVIIGLLHTCWQNTAPIRDDVTYKIFYGDKETYWIGMALTGTPYTFEENWGGVVGEVREIDGQKHVCGNTISHSSDTDKKLIWYNGSLLRNKYGGDDTYMVPQHYIVGGQCGFGKDPEFMACCYDGEIIELTTDERHILQKSVEIAQAQT